MAQLYLDLSFYSYLVNMPMHAVSESVSNCQDTNRSSPIHLLPDGEEYLYSGSAVKKNDAVLLVMAFILRFRLTAAATQSLLDLLNVLLPGCIVDTCYVLNKLFGSSSDQIQIHYYCRDESCRNYFGLEVPAKCERCGFDYGGDVQLCEKSFMLVMPLESQLKEVLLADNNFKLFCEGSQHPESRNGLSEVNDGSAYRQTVGKALVTLQFNCDGSPIFNSSQYSVWPLMCAVNEFPTAIRNRHIMLHTLWFGVAKPCPGTFLQPFLNEVALLYDSGMIVENSSSNCSLEQRVYVNANLCICDAPARSMLQNFTQYNGNFGCGFCYHPGLRVQKGSGSVQVYPMTEIFDRRTHEDAILLAEEATSTNKVVHGVKGASILLLFPQLDIISSFVPDYMHSVLLGVTRQFLSLWVDSSNHSKPYYIRNSGHLSKLLKGIRPPDEIHRLPRSLNDRKIWKAAEFRNFLLLYSPVILLHVMPRNYYRHWLLFVNGIRLLLEPCITSSMLETSRKCLFKFVSLVSTLYGDEHVSYNVHIMSHLPDAVADWGPLWSNSAFIYEDTIGNLKRLYHGTQLIPKQIFRHFNASRSLMKLNPLLINSSDEVVHLFKKLSTTQHFVLDATNVGIFTGLGRPLPETLNACQLQSVNELLQRDFTGLTGFWYKRFLINRKVFSTFNYCCKFRRDNSIVALRNGCIGRIMNCGVLDSKHVVIFVECYQCSSMKAFRDNAVGINLTSFIRKLDFKSKDVVCVRPEDIVAKCVIIGNADTSYVLPLPIAEVS